jgi:pyruvate kinase
MIYDIVATLGPASQDERTWERMLAAGVTGFRLNTSHLSLPDLDRWVARLDPFLAGRNPRPALILDLQGSKWRLGRFPVASLITGQTVTLVCAASSPGGDALPVPHPDFFQVAPRSGAELALSDAKIRLSVLTASARSMQARVLQGGEISSGKGITYLASTYRQESLGAKDRQILERTRPLASVRYALSYVRDAAEMARYRALIGPSAHLIAKLERPQALAEADGIAASANEVWLCRGDLGAELDDRAMAESVHRFSGRVRALAAPALLAGQVLEHMAEHPAPTRSEVCCLYDALARGYRGVVLSDETAVGRYPIESCRTAALFRGPASRPAEY